MASWGWRANPRGPEEHNPPPAETPTPASPSIAIQLDPLHLEAEHIAGIGSAVWELGQGQFWSDQFYRILGLEPGSVEPSFERFNASVHPDDLTSFLERQQAALAGEPCEVEFRIVRPGGEVRHVRSRTIVRLDDQGAVVRMFGCMLDLTERKRLEEHLEQAARLEAVGTLAAGLAHDFNNYLMVIGANLELLAESKGQPDDAFLEQARRAFDQCAGLTRQLLALARRQPLAPRQVEVRDLLLRTAEMLRRAVGPDIRLDVETGPTALYILADPSHLEQALVNLTVNARDALPDGGGIRFESALAAGDVAPIPERAALNRPRQPVDRWVRISVSDTSRGIPPELLPDIFEPYLTTEEAGHATGLGLASVDALVQHNGGRITVQSQVGQGTRFDLWFPAQDGGAVETEAPPAQPVANAAQTILVAEDMDAVRAVVVRALAMAGYEVLEAVDGKAALEVLETSNRPIHLLLTDVVMPRLGGVALADVVSQRFPATQVIFMTGCADQDSLSGHPTRVLSKPFRPAQLLALVEQVLAGKA